ncbi:MAG: citrate synthase [Oscillospiraceae bacterium]|nr:citrate synthase [Oscillospiraceae bacterium]
MDKILDKIEELKDTDKFRRMCEDFVDNSVIDGSLYNKFNVKRGLRNADGSGVVAGITNVCCVHGYVISEGDKLPIEGELIYRGYNVRDLVKGVINEKRFGYEEVAYLLLLGVLPNREELAGFSKLIAEYRELPPYFAEDVIMRNPSPNIMNKMQQSVLTLYSYDSDPENNSPEIEMLQAISVISKLPAIMVASYQAVRRFYHKESMVMHQINKEESLAESILSTLRDDRAYTPEEARLLDLCLMLHAEHGGGNNSTFTCRTVSSSGTDAYSAYAAAIGSLKGPRHGGANIKVMEMLDYVKSGVKNWEDDDEVRAYLRSILRKEAADRSGLIYGMGHAVYTLSDPRAVILKANAMELAKGTDFEREFKLLDSIERLTPEVFKEERGDIKNICANVDMYSGLVYKMLKIPVEMYTALFACARMAGWCAHRMEEMINGKRIIRPAYKAIAENKDYVPLGER